MYLRTTALCIRNMDDEELFQLQLDAAIAESLSLADQQTSATAISPSSSNHNPPQQQAANDPNTFMTPEELAFFTDAELPSLRAKEQERKQPVPFTSFIDHQTVPKRSADHNTNYPNSTAFSSENGNNIDYNNIPSSSSSSASSASLRPAASTTTRPAQSEALNNFWSSMVKNLGFTTSQATSQSANNNNNNPQRANSSSNQSNNTISSLLGMPKCPGCDQAIAFGKYFIINGDHYHEQCFKCMGCNELIGSGAVSYRGDQGLKLPYHPQCAIELFNPRCSLCNHALDGQFMRHHYFDDEKYCTSHGERNSCFACGRKEPLPGSNRDRFVDLIDGRSLCTVCSGTVIMDSAEAALIYEEVLQFFSVGLQLSVPSAMRTVPVLAVDVYTLNERLRKEQDLNAKEHEGHNGSMIRGLTLSTIGEIKHFSRAAPASSTSSGLGSFLSQLSSMQYRIEEVRDVTAILVLYGLPRDLFASILAHEAMHAWCKLTKTFPFYLPPKVEEGMCQLVAYKFLEHITSHECAMAATAEDENQQQRAFFRHQIATDTSPVYGDGFREAQKIESALGLAVLLEVVAEAKDFPSI